MEYGDFFEILLKVNVEVILTRVNERKMFTLIAANERVNAANEWVFQSLATRE